jgi:hypothetical protein
MKMKPWSECAHRQAAALRAHERDGYPLHLNGGIAGTAVLGGGNGAIFEALAIPLGSTVTLLSPPAFAGPAECH